MLSKERLGMGAMSGYRKGYSCGLILGQATTGLSANGLIDQIVGMILAPHPI